MKRLLCILFSVVLVFLCAGGCSYGGDLSHVNRPLSGMELPFVMPGETVVSHSTMEDGVQVRNYSVCYGAKSRVPLWVAYPLCDYYTERNVRRTDEWSYDPKISRMDQAELFRSGDFFANGYERGHQLPSADRTRSYEMNAQTFYFSNIAPMLAAKAFNGGLWSIIEDKVRDWSRSIVGTDTLYVVSGCMVDEGCKKVKDNRGLDVFVPSAYYKAVLQYSSKYGYRAIGIYLDHRDHSADRDFKQFVMSIDELESMLGMDFFPNLEAIVGKEQYQKIESANPLDEKFWWNN